MEYRIEKYRNVCIVFLGTECSSEGLPSYEKKRGRIIFHWTEHSRKSTEPNEFKNRSCSPWGVKSQTLGGLKLRHLKYYPSISLSLSLPLSTTNNKQSYIQPETLIPLLNVTNPWTNRLHEEYSSNFFQFCESELRRQFNSRKEETYAAARTGWKFLRREEGSPPI